MVLGLFIETFMKTLYRCRFCKTLKFSFTEIKDCFFLSFPIKDIQVKLQQQENMCYWIGPFQVGVAYSPLTLPQ